MTENKKTVYTSMDDRFVRLQQLTQKQIEKAKENGYTVRDAKTWEKL